MKRRLLKYGIVKKGFVLMLGVLLLTGCKENEQSSEVSVDVVNQETTSSFENETVKPISEYQDDTAKVSNTFVPEGDYEVKNGNFFLPEWSRYYSELSDLCSYAATMGNVDIVVGEVTKDIAYVGQYEEYSENSSGDMSGSTVYTFAVTDVLYGQDIEPESKITVFEPMNGYMKHKDKEGVYYYTALYGNAMVQQGDQYVMFLQKGEEMTAAHYGIEGDFYTPVGCHMGKYLCCDDGMYRRCSLATVDGLYHSEGEKMLFEEPMEYGTLKAKITDYLKGSPDNIVSKESNVDTKEKTVLFSQKIDLNEDGTMEELRVTALGKVDADNPQTVEQLIEEGGLIKFCVLDENGNVYKSYGNESEMTLYKEMYGNLQIFLTKDDDGNEVILVTKIQENRWMGYYEFNIYDVWQTRGAQEVSYSNYYTKSISQRTEEDKWYYDAVAFTKMKRNPLDTMEDTRTAVIPKYKHYLEPWIQDAVLLAAVDFCHDPIVLYSTKDHQIPATEYFEEVWNREETFVDGDRYYK